MDELTLDEIQKAIKTLDDATVVGETLYVGGISFHAMPEAVRERIKWAFDHIYTGGNLE